MNSKLPVGAFSAYVELGALRSYSAVARRFGVCRRTVAAVGSRERWPARARAIDRRAELVASLSIPDTATALELLELAERARACLAARNLEGAAQLLDRALRRCGVSERKVAESSG